MHTILKEYIMMLVISFKATIDFALKRDDLKEKVEEHLKNIINKK